MKFLAASFFGFTNIAKTSYHWRKFFGEKIMAIGLTNWFKKTFLSYEEETVRNRTKKGRFVADDPTTKNINEAYTTKYTRKK